MHEFKSNFITQKFPDLSLPYLTHLENEENDSMLLWGLNELKHKRHYIQQGLDNNSLLSLTAKQEKPLSLRDLAQGPSFLCWSKPESRPLIWLSSPDTQEREWWFGQKLLCKEGRKLCRRLTKGWEYLIVLPGQPSGHPKWESVWRDETT